MPKAATKKSQPVEGENDYLRTNITLRRRIKNPALLWAEKTGISLSEAIANLLEVKLKKEGYLKDSE